MKIYQERRGECASLMISQGYFILRRMKFLCVCDDDDVDSHYTLDDDCLMCMFYIIFIIF